MRHLKTSILAAVLTLLAAGAWADGVIDILPNGVTTTTIASPGSYRLAGSVTMTTNTTCIEITGNDITLDLNGHTLTGEGSGFGDGVRILFADRAWVHSGTIRNFGNSGIDVQGSDMAHLENVRSIGNTAYGFNITNGADDTIIRRCEAIGNVLFGLETFGLSGNFTVLDSVFDSNLGSGIHTQSGANHLISGNACVNNTGFGIQIAGGTAFVANNLAVGNSSGQYSGVASVTSQAASNERGDNLSP